MTDQPQQDDERFFPKEDQDLGEQIPPPDEAQAMVDLVSDDVEAAVEASEADAPETDDEFAEFR